MTKTPIVVSSEMKAAIESFADTIYLNAEEVDPDNEKDWNDIAYGWLRAKGISHEQANDYGVLSAMSCGYFHRFGIGT